MEACFAHEIFVPSSRNRYKNALERKALAFDLFGRVSVRYLKRVIATCEHVIYRCGRPEHFFHKNQTASR